MRKSYTRLMALVALLAVPTMAWGQSKDSTAAPAPAGRKGTPIEVTNNNFYDVHVYLIRSGAVFPVGVVSSFTTDTLQVPLGLDLQIADVRLLAAPIGGGGVYISPPLVFSRGDMLSADISNVLGLSTVSIDPARSKKAHR